MIFNSSKYNKHWQDKKLSELGNFQRGKSRHRPRNDPNLFLNGNHPLVQTGEIKEANLFIKNHKESYNDFGLAQSKLWPKNTLCITIAANIAETALLDYPMCFPDSIVGFNADYTESSEIFMHYVFTYIRRSIQNSATGSIQDNINIDYLTNLRFKIPSKNYQDKVVSILSVLDKKIELNNQINAELEKMAKTIYDYWFVQFDFPDKNDKPYKSSGGKMVWNEQLKREIPQDWEVKLLGSEIEIQRGISYTSKEINGEGISMINLNSFNLDGTYKSEGVKTYSGKYAEKNIIKSGDLLIAATDVTRNADIIGRAILVPDYYNDDLVFSMDIAKIISKNIPSSFLMMLFNSDHYHNYIKWYATGTLVLHLNLDGVKRYNTELPPISLLKKFDEFYLPIANRIYMTAKENQKLTELRDWVLPMLMNGQVKVN